MKNKIITWFAYTIFALVIPLVIINYHFPISFILNSPKAVQIGFGTFIAMIVLLTFFRKHIDDWVKSFDEITTLKGIFVYIDYIKLPFFMVLISYFMYTLGEKFLWVASLSLLSHCIAGFLYIRIKRKKVKAFKEWVRK